jgi:hypothetical protein
LTAAGVDQSNISKLTLQTGTQRVALEALLTSSVPEADKPCDVDIYYVNTQQDITANAAAVAQLYRISKKLKVSVPIAPGKVMGQVPAFLAVGGFVYVWVNHATKSGTATLTVSVNET